MADPLATGEVDRGAEAPLLKRLLAHAWEFDFFQAVWLIERYLGDRAPIGHRGPAASEPIRFRPHVSVGFPPTDVRRIKPVPGPRGAAPSYRMDVTFMGLYGVATPLPLHYAIRILRSVSDDDAPAVEQTVPTQPGPANDADELTDSSPERDFLDILHHRLISFFYRSWTKYRYYVAFGMPHHDRISDYLLWLIGCGSGWDYGLLGVTPLRLLRYAGALTHRPKSAVQLEGILYDYWSDIPVRVEQFVGRWVPLRADDLNRLGRGNTRLGVDLTVGEQVYDVSGAFNIRLGPVVWITYLSFLPDGRSFAETRALVCYYSTDPLSFSIEVRLCAGEVPELRLSSDDALASRLGYTSWVRTAEMPETSVTFPAN